MLTDFGLVEEVEDEELLAPISSHKVVKTIKAKRRCRLDPIAATVITMR